MNNFFQIMDENLGKKKKNMLGLDKCHQTGEKNNS